MSIVERPTGQTDNLKADLRVFPDTEAYIRDSYIFEAVMSNFYDDAKTKEQEFVKKVVERLKDWITHDKGCVIVFNDVLSDLPQYVTPVRAILTDAHVHPQEFYMWLHHNSTTPEFNEHVHAKALLHLAGFHRALPDKAILPIQPNESVPSLDDQDVRFARLKDSFSFSVLESFVDYKIMEALSNRTQEPQN